MPRISTFAENSKETNEVVSDADDGDSDENYMTKTDVDYLFAFKSMDVAIKSDQSERLRQESLEAKKLAELKEIKNKTGFTMKSSM